MTALDEILTDVAAFTADGQENFEDLGRAIYRGEKPSAVEVVETLKAAGKTTADLKKLVELFGYRDALREQKAERARFTARESELRREVDELNDELKRKIDALTAEHEQATQPRQAELATIRDWLKARPADEHLQLYNTCVCAELRAQLEQLIEDRRLAYGREVHFEQLLTTAERQKNHAVFHKAPEWIAEHQQHKRDAARLQVELEEQIATVQVAMQEW